MNEQTELLREMVELLRLIAEPEIVKRDKKRRALLRSIVGKSKPTLKAILAMDGSRSQAAIVKQAAIDQGRLSRLIKSLREADLIVPGDGLPKLSIPIPPNFPDDVENSDG